MSNKTFKIYCDENIRLEHDVKLILQKEKKYYSKDIKQFKDIIIIKI